ncbi:MAG: cupin domain-containing protein [Chloroflexi bacterium]|nr:cupin domain-containing protein [Chloroflexota bacterium]MCI0577831.1 cupin domain-containing protein [Chloroflexota bacterium]MCI0646128.1 cupin domain-containing protein [Chloroflexota bacterium]MCI0731330.1 cupin domain-containing protein [Chloroflexota bacterium]
MSEQGRPYHYVANLLELLPEIPADSIISRTVHSDAGLKATLFGFAAGQELTEHTASRPAVLHFLEGEAEVSLGQETMTAGPGAWIYMPPHLTHAIRAKTPVVMLLLLLHQPARDP